MMDGYGDEDIEDGEHRACTISAGLEVALRDCHRVRNDT